VASHHSWHFHPSGHPLLDHQHQELARELAHLEGLLHGSVDEALLLAQLTRLDHQTRAHFRCEEQLMAEQHYPHLDAHRQHHQQIEQQADALLRQYHKGRVSLADLITQFLQEVAAPISARTMRICGITCRPAPAAKALKTAVLKLSLCRLSPFSCLESGRRW